MSSICIVIRSNFISEFRICVHIWFVEDELVGNRYTVNRNLTCCCGCDFCCAFIRCYRNSCLWFECFSNRT